MTITFVCESCPSEFTVDDKLAGRSGKCKRCGARFVVPLVDCHGKSAKPQSTARPRSPVAASAGKSSTPAAPERDAAPPQKGTVPGRPEKILDRLHSSLVLKPMTEERLRLAQPKSSGTRPKPPVSSPSMGWLNAVNSQIALKPVTVNNLRSLRTSKDLQSDSISYLPAAPNRKLSRKKFKSNLPGGIKFNYEQTFRKTAKLFRWINETSYGISILFMLLAIVGYVIQLSTNNQTVAQKSNQTAIENPNSNAAPAPTMGIKLPPQPRHRFIKIGLSGIVVLNLVRLVAGLANLIVIPFRKSPIQGLMFLIPPMTFIYIWQHWKKVHKAVERIIGPGFALGLVVVAYILIPSLGHVRAMNGSLQDQVNDAVKSIQGDVNRSVKETREEIKTLNRQLPSQIEKATNVVEQLQGQAKEITEKSLPKQIENAEEAIESAKEQVQKAINSSPELNQDDDGRSQSSAKPKAKTEKEPK